jgi:ATP-binding cassette subfamily B protein
VLDLVQSRVEVPDGDEALPREAVGGAIAFRGVSFSYDRGVQKAPTLNDITLDIGAGRTVAFVGSTGSGKSTLVKLLLRFYTPDEGTITLDGRPLEAFKLRDLRRAIGYVAQEPFLADATVAENIAYGDEEASGEAIRAAAEAAEAAGFIAGLPHGYDTQVGERGQKLSGGQRQRIALARALLKAPPILILDEATSAVDNETEAAIQRSLARAVVGRTSVIIAHRLSTVRHADTIHVLEDGAIVETGTHESLLAAGKQYAALWRLQTGQGNDGGDRSAPPNLPRDAGAAALKA